MNEILVYPETLWAGTDHSFDVALAAHAAILAGAFSDRPLPKDEVPYTFDLQGSTGVISIRGSLVNEDSPWNRLFGVTSYAEVRRALIYAAQSPDVKSILLDITSGGGAVSGVDDTARLIAEINDTTKPVYAYTDGGMLSAAYWLGSSAKSGVYNGRTANVGSVGIITTVKEYSQAYKQAGIGVKVLRSGKYKALVNPNEPLSAKAEEQLQQQMDEVYKVFAGHVAEMLGMSFDKFESTIGQGREFLGKAAADVKATDGVATFDEVMAAIASSQIDRITGKAHTAPNLNRGGLNMKKAFSPQELEALAAGKTADQIAAEQEAAEKAARAAAEQAAAAEKDKGVAAANEAVTVLAGQLRETSKELAEVTVKAAQAEATAKALEATHTGLLEIVAASLTTMKVALGVTGFDASKMNAEQVISDHKATVATYVEKFPIGGVATPAKGEKQADTKKLGQLDAEGLIRRVEANRYTK